MGEYVVKRPVKRPPLHPGEIVREDVLPALGLSVSTAVMSLTRASIRSFLLAPSATFAPLAARRRAVLSPRPLLAPVITTTFPSMFTAIIPPFANNRRLLCND